MSEVSAAARLTLVVADFINADAAGKTNIVGGGVAFVAFDPMQGVTTRFSVWAHVAVPDRLLPAEFSIELALMDGDDVFAMPTPGMEPQAVRMAQPVMLDKSSASVVSALRAHAGASHQMIVDFGNGLPLRPNGAYDLRLQIDGDKDHELRYPIGVAGPLPGAVIG